MTRPIAHAPRRGGGLQRLRGSISLALASLWTNKLRSFLTLLGVIIGVTTVITVVAIIDGMNRYVIGTFSSFGADNFSVTKFGLITSMEDWFDALKRKDLTLKEAELIRSHCTLCEDVGVDVWASGTIKAGRESISDSYIIGITPNIPDLNHYVLERGIPITEADVRHRRNVCLIGWEIADVLFSGLDPLGKTLRAKGVPFQVAGVIKKRGSFLGENLDNFIFIPLLTFDKHFRLNGQEGESLEIVVKAGSQARLQPAQDQVRAILRSARHIPHKEKDDFGIMTTGTLIDLYRGFTSVAYLVMIGIASISLVVGGIVIMNIMLVSVTERTREIGIRKAVGARRADILRQFLAESVTIAAIGGALGILLGALLAWIVSHASPLPSAIRPWSVLSGLVVASSVGIFFGLYPALKAARLDPIEALRSE